MANKKTGCVTNTSGKISASSTDESSFIFAADGTSSNSALSINQINQITTTKSRLLSSI